MFLSRCACKWLVSFAIFLYFQMYLFETVLDPFVAFFFATRSWLSDSNFRLQNQLAESIEEVWPNFKEFCLKYIYIDRNISISFWKCFN